MTTTTETTVSQIKALRTEAGMAGDSKMVAISDAALDLGKDSSEWAECARVIAEAQG